MLINLRPPSSKVTIVDRHERTFKGLRTLREYRVINLWTVDVALAFQARLKPLLPFVPIHDVLQQDTQSALFLQR